MVRKKCVLFGEFLSSHVVKTWISRDHVRSFWIAVGSFKYPWKVIEHWFFAPKFLIKKLEEKQNDVILFTDRPVLFSASGFWALGAFSWWWPCDIQAKWIEAKPLYRYFLFTWKKYTQPTNMQSYFVSKLESAWKMFEGVGRKWGMGDIDWEESNSSGGSDDAKSSGAVCRSDSSRSFERVHLSSWLKTVLTERVWTTVKTRLSWGKCLNLRL